MKHLVQIMTMTGLLALGSTAYAAELTITVTNIQTPEGKLYIRIYDSGKKWLSQEENAAHTTEVIPLSVVGDAKEITATFELPEGKYAVTAIHDKNSNGILDKNWMGMPTEPSGNSSTTENKKGPPSFEESTFEVTGNTQKTLPLISY